MLLVTVLFIVFCFVLFIDMIDKRRQTNEKITNKIFQQININNIKRNEIKLNIYSKFNLITHTQM